VANKVTVYKAFQPL